MTGQLRLPGSVQEMSLDKVMKDPTGPERLSETDRNNN
jgi:hypothetical protein